MPLTREKFIEIGEALHGQFWKRPLARDLDNSSRTVERWADGTDPIPAGVAADLAGLCAKHAASLIALAREL